MDLESSGGQVRAAFGDCEFDAARVELRRAGELVDVQPQVFAVLDHLIRHRDRVVPKEELLDEIWGDRFVSEATLASRIKFVRRAVGDDGKRQSIIKTVHGRGYRFVAEVVLGSHDQQEGEKAVLRTDETIDTGLDLAGDDEWPMIGRFNSLDIAMTAFAEGVGGIVVSGPDRVGKTRLATEVVQRCRSAGHRTVRVTASAPASKIPLAALAPLVPTDVLQVDGTARDFTQTLVLRQAQSAIEENVPSGARLVILVDDAQYLDDVSESLLASMMSAGTAFVVATQRTNPQRRRAFDELIRSETVRDIPLQALDDTDVDTLLYRVLQGPIDPFTLARLGEIAAGKPGLLRDVVEASLDAASLAREQGAWRLVGPAISPQSRSWPIEGLSAQAIRATEMLGLIRDLPLPEATALFGEEALDELDHAGLIGLAVDASGQPVISLSDVVLAERLPDTVPPFRRRRHKQELTATLLAGKARPSNLATIVSWVDELDGEPVDAITALLAARRALLAGEDDAAEALADYLRRIGESANPFLAVIDAEICFRRAQLQKAEGLLSEIDTAQLDDFTAGFVLRRIATIQTQLHGTYAESVDWLVDREASASGAIRESLAAQRFTTLVLLGRVDELLSAADDLLEGASDINKVEMLLARSRGYVLAGQIDHALSDLDQQDRLMSELTLTGPEADLPLEAASAIRLSCALPRGELEPAVDMIRSWSVTGKRTIRTWLPLMAAQVQMEAGKPRLARELIRPGMEINRRRDFVHGRLLSEARYAVTSAELGKTSEAEELLDTLFADMHMTGPGNIWNLIETMTEIALRLGRAHECTERAMDLADEAQAHGANLAAANIWFATATANPTSDLAPALLERVAPIAQKVGGSLWPIRLAHIEAVARGESLSGVIDSYRRIGHIGSARRAALARELTG